MEKALRTKRLVSALIVLLAACSFALFSKTNTAYAEETFSGTCGGCNWTLVCEGFYDGVLTIEPTNGQSGQLASCTSADQWPWQIYRYRISEVKIKPGVTEGDGLAGMFYECHFLKKISFPEGFGSNATNMSSMFEGCESYNPTEAFPAGFGSNATNMSSMFEECYKLSSVKAFPAGFGSNATNMSNMFTWCSTFNPTEAFPADFGSKATDMSSMFYECQSFNPTEAFPADFGSKATDMSSMFDSCQRFNPTEAFPAGFGQNATDMSSMFNWCIDFNPTEAFPAGFGSKATNMSFMFVYCSLNPTEAFPADFGSKATDMSGMFMRCEDFNPTEAFPAGFGSEATTMAGMFMICEAFNPTEAFPAGFGSKATNMERMFEDCMAFNTTNPFPAGFGSKVTNMDRMFANCESLVSIDLSSMDTRKVVPGDNEVNYAFIDCDCLRMVKLGENWSFNGAGASRLSVLCLPSMPVTKLTTGRWICIDGQNEGKAYDAAEIPNGAGIYKCETTYTIENKEVLEELWNKYKAENPGATITVEFVASEDNVNADDVALIQKQAGNKNLFCFDARIVVTVDGRRVTAASLEVPLVVSYPFDCSNIDELTVYRVHDGQVEELPLNASEYADHIKIDKEKNTITISSSKYSTYAFAYKESVPTTGDSSSAGIALSLAAMLCASVCLVAAYRRKA